MMSGRGMGTGRLKKLDMGLEVPTNFSGLDFVLRILRAMHMSKMIEPQLPNFTPQNFDETRKENGSVGAGSLKFLS